MNAFVSLNPSNFSRKLEKKIDSIVAPLCDSNGGGAKALLQFRFVVFGFKVPVVDTPGGRALGGCRYPGTAVLDFGRQVGWITKQYNCNKYLLAINIIFKNSNHVQVFICIDVFHESRVVF